LVLWCGRLLKANDSIDTNSSHRSWWSSNYVRNLPTMVQLYRSTWPFVCGWYVVEYRLEIPRSEKTPWKNVERNWGPLSDNTVAGGPYAATQWSKKAAAMVYASIHWRGMARVILEKRSTMTNRCSFPAAVRGRWPSRSIHRSVSGSVGGKFMR